MSSAAGHGRFSTRSASSIVAKAVNGFHLLRIDGYSQTKTLLPGQKLSSLSFVVGGHSWRIDYYPNGRASANSNAMSVYLQLADQAQQGLPQVEAQYKFSLLDHAGNAAYELPAESGSFTSVAPQVGPYYNHNGVMGASAFPESSSEKPGSGCGHEEFIGTEELERHREHLIRDDSIVIRCDIAVTQFDASWLANEELSDLGLEDEEDLEDEGYGPPGYRAHLRRHHPHRADDSEYIKRFLAQRPGRGRGYGRPSGYHA